MVRRLVLVLLVAATACDGGGGSGIRPRGFGGDRPVTLQVPPQLDESRSYPLLLVLHGYGANGFVQQAYFGAGELAARGDAFVLAPDGLVDSTNHQFWNADDFCCDFDNTNVDDVAYLGGLVEDVMEVWPVDPGAVFAIGHSNGGFMSYRLACERADLFAAILALAGNAVNVPCAPAEPVSILHAHGTDDDTVPYTGATPSVDTWAELDGCTGPRARGADLDLETGIPGAETRTDSTTGCPAGVAVDLWTIAGASHIPSFDSRFTTAAWAWLTDHRRP